MDMPRASSLMGVRLWSILRAIYAMSDGTLPKFSYGVYVLISYRICSAFLVVTL
jgi:hypothetical protein